MGYACGARVWHETYVAYDWRKNRRRVKWGGTVIMFLGIGKVVVDHELQVFATGEVKDTGNILWGCEGG